ncbi:MAG: carbonic anhydrase [Meiothermus sp.]|nr:carbonic anhydrase [Meiothermus sp.]
MTQPVLEHAPHPVLTPDAQQPSPDEALEWLVRGNARYVLHHSRHPRQGGRARLKLAKGQHPFAVVLGCADSRVAPEVIFDQGLGDLFVVRIAGNIVDEAVRGSLEFAVTRFGVPLIVVLGHDGCGALQAALDAIDHPRPMPPAVQALLEPILPAVRQAIDETEHALVPPSDESILQAAQAIHTARMVEALRADEVLAPLIERGRLEVVGGRYDLQSGQVVFALY